MTELLPLSIGVGLAVGLLFTEKLGIAAGGLIVPGYMALFLTQPLTILTTLAVAVVTFGVVRSLSTFLVVYGRRRTALMILVGFLLGSMARHLVPTSDGELTVIGFIIPGLVAIWMDRQGVLQTLTSLAIVSVVVRLLLVLAVGSDLP